MITLSYTSISGLHEHPHYWLNRMMGAKMPEWEFFKAGKLGHRLVQDHVSGIKLDDRIKDFNYSFPMVEECDFDKKMNFRIQINEKYEVQGFFDGLNLEEAMSLEIKTGAIWSLGKFQKSFQRKIYALLKPDIKKQVMFTAPADPNKWAVEKPKIWTINPTQADRDEALAYILDGIAILESGVFTTDLVESSDGRFMCTDPRCLYGENCQFK